MKKKPDGITYPLRLPPELALKVAEAAVRLGLKQSDVMRLCLQIGLHHFEAAGWDIAKAVFDHGRRQKLAGLQDEPGKNRGRHAS